MRDATIVTYKQLRSSSKRGNFRKSCSESDNLYSRLRQQIIEYSGLIRTSNRYTRKASICEKLRDTSKVLSGPLFGCESGSRVNQRDLLSVQPGLTQL